MDKSTGSKPDPRRRSPTGTGCTKERLRNNQATDEQMREIDGESGYEKMRLAVEKANQRLAAAQFPSRDRPERRGPKRGEPERDYGPSR